MIVKNGGICYCKTLVSSDSSIPADTLKDINGTMYASPISKGDLHLDEVHIRDSQRGIKMRLGVGIAEPTVDDYKLYERLIDGVDVNTSIVCVNASIGYGVNGEIIYTFTFQNSTTSPITVKEACLECTPSVSGGANIPTFMLARTLITPRTFTAGMTGSFSYTINPCGGD